MDATGERIALRSAPVPGRTVPDPEMLDPDLGPVVVAVGQFDGVHRGHRRLLDHARRLARRSGTACGVVTFDDHPAAVLAPGRVPRRLTTNTDRLALLERSGVDFVLALPLTAGLLGTPAPEFVEDLLVRRLGARTVVVGANFRFGRGAAGDPAALRRWGRPHGMSAVAMTLLDDGAFPISSTRIRAEIAAGRVVEAADLLGRPHAVPVLVEAVGGGRVRGRVVDGMAVPRAGLYRGRIAGDDHVVAVDVAADGTVSVPAVPVPAAAAVGGTISVRFVRGSGCDVR